MRGSSAPTPAKDCGRCWRICGRSSLRRRARTRRRLTPMNDDKPVQGKPFDTLNTRGLIAKREYVQGLEQRRDVEALSLLVECLCDQSWYLRDQAERAFVRLGDDG